MNTHWSTHVDVTTLKKIWQEYTATLPLPFLDKWLKHEGKFNPLLRQFSISHQLLIASAMMDALRFMQLAVVMEALYQKKITVSDLASWDKNWQMSELNSIPNQYFWFWVVLRTEGDVKKFSVKDYDKRRVFFREFFSNKDQNFLSSENLLWNGFRLAWRSLLQERQQKSQWSDQQLSQFIEQKNTLPPVWLRLQKNVDVKVLQESLSLQGVDSIMDESGAIGLVGGRGVTSTLEYRDGKIEIQDLASQFIAKSVKATPGQKVWDVCAGAGGKSLAIAVPMANKGMLLATDIHQYKLDELKRRAKRAEVFNIRQFLWSADEPLRLPKEVAQQKGFDWVLVDAPCSSSGTWRRNPDALWRFSEENTRDLCKLQQKILHQAHFAVRPLGHLVYATCSWQFAENESQVDAFLKSHPEFSLVTQTLPGCPDLDSDTMFVAVMKRD